MNFGQNRDNLRLLAACATEDAPLLMLTLSALWSHDTTVYRNTPTASAPQVSWTVVGGVIQRQAGAIAPLIRLSCAEQTSVSNTGEQGYCYWSCKRGFSAHSWRTHWNTPSILLVEVALIQKYSTLQKKTYKSKLTSSHMLYIIIF